MKLSLVIACIVLFNSALAQQSGNEKQHRVVIVVHGGAGTILKSHMTPEQEKAYTEGLKEALRKGYELLQKGSSSLDAVEAAVRVLEDNPLFNAGKGAVFTNEGKNELDASIMDGKTLAAGSVAGVTTIRNPISAARAVMEKSEHVMMVGKGAEKFASQQGIEIVDPSYFHTESRWKSLQNARKRDSTKTEMDHSDKKDQRAARADIHNSNTATTKNEDANFRASVDPDLVVSKNNYYSGSPLVIDSKFGTVGAVALDRYGNLAAATSTGGMTNKRFGRVGDAPIIGAGTYANNATCAISCTGWGEFFIRLVIAKTVSDMMEFGKMSLKDAAHEMIMKRLPALQGDGGLIALDKDGNIAMPFCTEGMYRGYVDKEGKMEVRIYKE